MYAHLCVVCVKAAPLYPKENVLHTRNVARARTCVLYGETWPYVFSRRVFGVPTIRAFPPVDSFRVFREHTDQTFPSFVFLLPAARTFLRSYLSATIAVIYDLEWWI